MIRNLFLSFNQIAPLRLLRPAVLLGVVPFVPAPLVDHDGYVAAQSMPSGLLPLPVVVKYFRVAPFHEPVPKVTAASTTMLLPLTRSCTPVPASLTISSAFGG